MQQNIPNVLKPRKYIFLLSFAILLVILIASTFAFGYFKDIQEQKKDSDITEIIDDQKTSDTEIPTTTETEMKEEEEKDETVTPPTVKPPVKKTPPTVPVPKQKPTAPEFPSAVVAFYADPQPLL